MKRKHEAEETLKNAQQENVETSMEAIKRKRTDDIDKLHGEKSSKSILVRSKDEKKNKKKKGQKNIIDRNHTPAVSPNLERSKGNNSELHTESENKSLSHKKKKKRRRNNNKYKDLNIKQKAEMLPQNCIESKDSIRNKFMLVKQDSRNIEENANVFVPSSAAKEEVQSSQKKEIKKKKKIKLLESKYNSVSQDRSIVNKNSDTVKSPQNASHGTNIVTGHENKVNHNHSPATSVDAKIKKKKKKKSASTLLDSHALSHSKEIPLFLEASECTQNDGFGEKLKVKKKIKLKGRKTTEGNIKTNKGMENFMGTGKSGKTGDNYKQDVTVKKKKKKKETIEENGTSLNVKDTVSHKKAKLVKQKANEVPLNTEDSEAEDMIFDANEECSEEFNKDFDALLSSLNFNQFSITKKSKKKGCDDGNSKGKSLHDVSKMKNGRNSFHDQWEGTDDESVEGVQCKRRKRDIAEADSKEILGRQKKVKTKTNNLDPTEEPKTPIKKSAKFNREKLSKLLEKAASMEQKSSPSPPSHPVDTLKKRMEDRLTAARFRLVNQELYTKSSIEAKQLFKKDPEAFDVYHQGYQAQVRQWPVNPLDLIITWLSKKPKEWVVADMGCGEAMLAQRVPQSHVHSLDLVAANARVTACDMAHTPLASASVDVVVFCLSLMGTNLKDFMIEANRILRERGIMKIAEVESRCGNVKEFEKQLEKFGFHCTGRDTSHQYFFLLEFKKNRRLKKTAALPDLHLKACLYKKR